MGLLFCCFLVFFYLIKKVADSMTRSMHTASLCILPCVGYWRCLVFLCCSLSLLQDPPHQRLGATLLSAPSTWQLLTPSEPCFVGSPRGWSSLCKGWCPSAGYHLLFALCRVKAHQLIAWRVSAKSVWLHELKFVWLNPKASLPVWGCCQRQ